MPFIADRVMDLGLNVLDTEATALYVTSLESVTYASASATHALGVKTALNVGAPGAGSPNGRQVTVAAITDGTITATGTATHWAIVDVPNSRLLATGALAAGQAVTNGNTFTLGAFTIRIPAAA